MNRSPEVESWFEGQDPPMAEGMQVARDIILSADDRVTETIKWSTPTFVYEGNILSFTPSKTAISLMFHRGAEIPGSHPLLEGDGRLVRTMRFMDAAEVKSARREIEKAVRAWCAWRDAETG